MQCPQDQAVLQMTERQGIEIDYCPTCRGVWLDRGELDKLIEKSAVAAPSPQSAYQPAHQQPAHRPDFADSDFDSRQSQGYGQRRKKSWLSEIFD